MFLLEWGRARGAAGPDPAACLVAGFVFEAVIVLFPAKQRWQAASGEGAQVPIPGRKGGQGLDLRSLRGRLELAAIALVVLAGVASVALMVLPSLVHQQVVALDALSLKSRFSEEMKIQLLVYERASDRWVLTRDSHFLTFRREHRDALLSELAEAQRLAADPAELAAVEAVARGLAGYLSARESAEVAGGDLAEELSRIRSALTVAMGPLDDLVSLYAKRSDKARKRAQEWDTLGDVTGVFGVVVLLGGVATIFWWARREVYVPLHTIRHAIADLGAGTRGSRAPEDAPEEIAGIARAFNLMAAHLEREREGRAAFLAAVAHELRTPLSALKVATASLKLGTGEPRHERLLGTMERQISRLDRMLGDLLFAARAEAGQMELSFQPCDLRRLVSEALELYQSFSAQHELAVALPEGAIWIRGDPVRLEQVLVNLVSNAFKYSPAGGRVEVRLARQGGEALLEVGDQGIGIAPEDLEELFEPFRRVGALRREVSGVGLGLSVTRRLVEAHGGRIEVESISGKGSLFRIHLPLADAPDAPDDL